MDSRRRLCSRVLPRGLIAVVGLLGMGQVYAANVTLAWDPVAETNVVGYVLYYGGATGVYTNEVRSTNATATVTGLVAGQPYFFVVVSVDSAGRRSSPSAEIVHAIPDPGAPGDPSPGGERQFVGKVEPGSVRNDFSGFLGMKFTTGEKPLLVTALGRLMVEDNTGVHLLKLADDDGADLEGASVAVRMRGAVGEFRYGALRKPIALAARTTYYLLSGETHGGDRWYDADSTVVVSEGRDVRGVYKAANGWVVVGDAGHAFGVLGFKYLSE